MSKKVAHICKNCVLYNPKESVCAVTVLYKGEALELQTKPNDKCHWEQLSEDEGIDMLEQIKEIRVFKENGKDYISLPDDPKLQL